MAVDPRTHGEVRRLECTTCGMALPWGYSGPCAACGGILECVYPKESLTCLRNLEHGRGLFGQVCFSTSGIVNKLDQSTYRPLLPVEGELCSLGEGNTPLLHAHNLATHFGLRYLYLKNETLNPTGSFKDRGAAIAVTRAVAAGARGVLTASTGNAAAALAAYSASQQLRCLVLVSSASPQGKLRQALAYGAVCIPVAGLFDGEPQPFVALLLELSAHLGLELAFFWAPVSPYPLEGMKTIAYETVAQLGQVPDVLVCPVGGGDGLVGQWRGYLELLAAGVINRVPRMIGVQSDGAAPLVLSLERGLERVMHIAEAHTVASGLQVTFSGDHALRAIRASGGTAVAVPDKDILAAQRLLARQEGVWAEPSGAVGIAALPKLLQQGLIAAAERIVCVVTGAGYKDRHHDGVDAEPLRDRPVVPFDLEAIEQQARASLNIGQEEAIS